MTEMTTHERVKRMFEHKEADRVPVIDSPWNSTIERWQKEGMPEDVSFIDYFDLDKFVSIWADNSPQYPVKVIEETEDYVIKTSQWGATLKEWKHSGGVPEFVDFKITSPEAWEEAKSRMKPSRDRINWERLENNYDQWREEGAWISGSFWFGFDVVHSWMVGTERILMAMVNEKDWFKDMLNTYLELDLALFDMIWDEGYHFDEIHWPDDMGYKGHQFFSVDMYRELVKPFHKKAVDWAHEKGIKVRLHSCGNVNPLVPEFIDIGIDMLNPLEVKAGMDPVSLKKKYGDKMGFHGGLNAVLFTKSEKLWTEMKKIIPVMKENGGYIISSDHSVPEAVSLEEFGEFVDLAKELGSY